MKEIRLLKASEIECRVGQIGRYSGKTNGWCTLLLYKDARCDMKLMDEVFGTMGWKKSYELINGNLFCTVSVYDEKTKDWISRQDVGTESNTEKEKGQASDAFKRACVNWGIGRELYTAPLVFVQLSAEDLQERNGRLGLSNKCKLSVAEIGYDDERNINALTIVDQNGVVRYKLGQQMQQPKQSSESNDIDDQFNSFALPSIQQARTREELTRIWNDFPQLQDDGRFLAALNNRQNEINNNKAA